MIVSEVMSPPERVETKKRQWGSRHGWGHLQNLRDRNEGMGGH